MWDYLKPDWTVTQMMWHELKIFLLEASRIESGGNVIQILWKTMGQTESGKLSQIQSKIIVELSR